MAVVDLAWQTTAAVAPEDVWKTLSRGTADEHGKLDASLSALPLHTDAGTAAFIAAMAAAEPTSAWHPHSAPEIEALVLISPPTAAAVSRNSGTRVLVAPGTWSSQ